MEQATPFLGSHWLVTLAVAGGLLLATEIGFRLSHQFRERLDDATRTQVGIVQGSLLAVIGLVAGCTFAMSVSRYEARKQVLLDEVNAIGTTALRAELLPEPARTTAYDVLRRYVDVRLDFFAAGEDTPGAAKAEAELGRLQGELWS